MRARAGRRLPRGRHAAPTTPRRYRAANVVFATGYYDNPNFLRVPGEDLPHVAHYFLEGHPYWHRRVIVIGAGNSSVDAALECWRAGATVTLVHFGEGFDRTVKAWVLPDITNRVKEGSIAVRWRSRIRAITPTEVESCSDVTGAAERLPADAVLAMTGYHADTTLLRRLGVPVDEASGVPAHDERTMGTPVEGVYLAGVIASGNDANRLFIENARGPRRADRGDIVLARRRTAGRRARQSLADGAETRSVQLLDRDPVIPLAHHLDECRGHRRIELGPRPLLDVVERLGRRPGVAIGPAGAQRVVHVAHVHQPARLGRPGDSGRRG